MRIVQFCYKDEVEKLNNISSKNDKLKVGIQLNDEYGDIINLNALNNIVPFQIKNSLELITLIETKEDFKESLKR